MNAIELLKEAAQALETVQHYFPAQDEADKGLAVADVDACQRLMTKIEAYLAEPEPDAMELVSKIREPTMISPIDVSRVREDLVITYQTNWKLTYSEAAALIEDYGRRVPRAMLEEVYIEASRFDANGEYESIDEIAAKYSVQVEG